jgi:hypothetical protein
VCCEVTASILMLELRHILATTAGRNREVGSRDR